MPYNAADLGAKLISAWSGGNFALFSYPPRWRERLDGVNDTTRLILPG